MDMAASEFWNSENRGIFSMLKKEQEDLQANKLIYVNDLIETYGY